MTSTETFTASYSVSTSVTTTLLSTATSSASLTVSVTVSSTITSSASSSASLTASTTFQTTRDSTATSTVSTTFGTTATTTVSESGSATASSTATSTESVTATNSATSSATFSGSSSATTSPTSTLTSTPICFGKEIGRVSYEGIRQEDITHSIEQTIREVTINVAALILKKAGIMLELRCAYVEFVSSRRRAAPQLHIALVVDVNSDPTTLYFASAILAGAIDAGEFAVKIPPSLDAPNGLMLMPRSFVISDDAKDGRPPPTASPEDLARDAENADSVYNDVGIIVGIAGSVVIILLVAVYYLRLKREKHCAKCGAPATMSCERCERVRYCSTECQAVHWAKHQAACNRFIHVENVAAELEDIKQCKAAEKAMTIADSDTYHPPGWEPSLFGGTVPSRWGDNDDQSMEDDDEINDGSSAWGSAIDAMHAEHETGVLMNALFYDPNNAGSVPLIDGTSAPWFTPFGDEGALGGGWADDASALGWADGSLIDPRTLGGARYKASWGTDPNAFGHGYLDVRFQPGGGTVRGSTGQHYWPTEDNVAELTQSPKVQSASMPQPLNAMPNVLLDHSFDSTGWSGANRGLSAVPPSHSEVLDEYLGIGSPEENFVEGRDEFVLAGAVVNDSGHNADITSDPSESGKTVYVKPSSVMPDVLMDHTDAPVWDQTTSGWGGMGNVAL